MGNHKGCPYHEQSMTYTLKSYPAYKPSGVEWLGEIPEHWELKKLKFIAAQVSEKVEIKSDNINYIGLENIESWTGKLVESELVTEGTASRFRKKDVLFGKLRPYLAKVYLAEDEGFCSTEALVLRTSSQNPRFLFYFLLSRIFIDLVNSSVYGANMPRASWDFIGSQLLPFPLPDEQHRIATFLDQKTAEIDEAISKKQRLIDLLKEQKAILINQAVTKGLNPNVPMRDSGVEWIGEVPAHWEIVRNGRLFVQRNEIGFPELPILQVSLKTGIRIRDFENSDRKQVMSDRSMYKRAVKGDIAYNMMRMWQGAVGVTPVDGLVSPAYVVAKPLTGTEPRYFGALFRTSAYIAEVDKYSRGIVKDRNRLYWEDFKQIPTPCPPPDEQVLIADAIEHNTTTIDEGIHRIERQISLFHEYRTILIANVVTGKLDVREGAGEQED